MKNILVVDDNEMLCRLACDILRTEGYRAVPPRMQPKRCWPSKSRNSTF